RSLASGAAGEAGVDREDLSFLIRFLRVYCGLDRAELAQAAGLDPSSLWRYEQGKMTASRPALERLAGVANWTWEFVEEKLLPRLRALRLLVEREAARTEESLEQAARTLAERLQERALELFAELGATPQPLCSRAGDAPAAADRQEAE